MIKYIIDRLAIYECLIGDFQNTPLSKKYIYLLNVQFNRIVNV